MEDFYNSRNSIYCYPGTNLLKNKLDIHDSNKLFELEKQIVLVKLYILRQNTSIYEFDKQHFIHIHITTQQYMQVNKHIIMICMRFKIE